MIDWMVNALLVTGAIFVLLAGVGILRLPDVFMRVSAISKAVTLGVGCFLLAALLHFQEIGVAARALLIIAFYFLTSPVSAHVICRAAYIVGAPLWKETFRDELRGRYDLKKRILRSTEPGPGGPKLQGKPAGLPGRPAAHRPHF